MKKNYDALDWILLFVGVIALLISLPSCTTTHKSFKSNYQDTSSVDRSVKHEDVKTETTTTRDVDSTIKTKADSASTGFNLPEAPDSANGKKLPVDTTDHTSESHSGGLDLIIHAKNTVDKNGKKTGTRIYAEAKKNPELIPVKIHETTTTKSDAKATTNNNIKKAAITKSTESSKTKTTLPFFAKVGIGIGILLFILFIIYQAKKKFI